MLEEDRSVILVNTVCRVKQQCLYTSAVVLKCLSGGRLCVCGLQPAVTQLQECPNEVTAVAAVGFV